ncbi:hypothetical protein ACLOJK_012101 [Asimina triloba]
MKREGRQHGMVRSYMLLPAPWNPRTPKTKVVNQFSSPPTAGGYTKVPSKPTNHSKFTGKCGRARCVGCHLHPACKSEEKSKGARKLRSLDVSLNHRLIAWRVVDNGGAGFNCSGISATRMLDYLSGGYCEVEDDDDDDDVDVGGDVEEDSAAFGDGLQAESSGATEEDGKRLPRVFEIGFEEDGDFGFYDIGFGWDFDVENCEDWFIVEDDA